MKLVKFILIFLIISFTHSCLKNSSSTTKSEQNSKDDFYLYRYDSKDGTDYICQYKCLNSRSKNLSESCKKYYIKAESSGLDNDTLQMIKTPDSFIFYGDKSFTLKNVKSLLNLSTTKDSKNICNDSYLKETESYTPNFIKIYNNELYSENIVLSSQNKNNDTWNKYLLSYNYSDPIAAFNYKKNVNKNELILLIGANDNCENYNSKEILIREIKASNLIKKEDILENREYLGLSLQDCIADHARSAPCLGIAYGGFFDKESVDIKNLKYLCNKDISPIQEDEKLKFIQKFSTFDGIDSYIITRSPNEPFYGSGSIAP